MFKQRVRKRNDRGVHLGKSKTVNFIKSDQQIDVPAEHFLHLRYFIPQVLITGKILNGYPMFSVKNIVLNVKLIELLGKNSVPLHFVISKS